MSRTLDTSEIITPTCFICGEPIADGEVLVVFPAVAKGEPARYVNVHRGGECEELAQPLFGHDARWSEQRGSIFIERPAVPAER